MTLILAARCKNGCVVLSDHRCHVKSASGKTYSDDYEKVVTVCPYLVYNHGYNRIDGNDWKSKADILTPDVSNPVYLQVQEEMRSKPDRVASYVFVNKKEFHEVRVDADGDITIKSEPSHDRIVSGSGDKYVDITVVKDLQKKKMREACQELKAVFRDAHKKLADAGGDEFSETCQPYYIAG